MDAHMQYHNSDDMQPAGVAHVPEYNDLQLYGNMQNGQNQPQFPAPGNGTKKRRIGDDEIGDGDGFEIDDLPLVETGLEGWKPTKLLKITDAIETLARDGRSLTYDPQNNTYTVLDGVHFEEEFNALRATRNKKNEAAKDRPFSRMHRFYTLLQGEKWAGTGSIFTPKSGLPPSSIVPNTAPSPSTVSHSSPQTFSPVSAVPGLPHSHVAEYMSPSTDARSPSSEPSHLVVSADNVSVSIVGPSGDFEHITLQHFLDVTGAGELYTKAVNANSNGEGFGPDARSSAQPLSSQNGLGPNTALGIPPVIAPGSSPQQGIPMLDFSQQQLEAPLQITDIYKVVGGVWNADSKGDQAYFFKRRTGVMPVFNGAIVGVISGELVKDDAYAHQRVVGPAGAGEEEEEGDGSEGRGLWMVVSDKNAKWKGEPLPTPEEEEAGHWCCFLGQVPVCVEGVVRSGDHIGPKCDGSGLGRVVQPGRAQPVIGIALADKANSAPGIVKTLCFAGLNALSESAASDQLSELFERMLETEKRLAALEDKVKGVAGNVQDIEMGVVGTRGEVETLAARVSLIERLQFWRKPANKGAEEEASEVANASVAVGIPLNHSRTAPANESGLKAVCRRHPLYLGTMVGILVALALTLALVFALKAGGAGGEEEMTEILQAPANATVIYVGSDHDDD